MKNQEWIHLRTELIGKYISTIINNNRCKVYFTTSGIDKEIQMYNKEVKYIKCTENCKINEAKVKIMKQLYESDYLETVDDKVTRDLSKQNTVLNAAKFLKDNNISVGCKGYDKNISLIYIHSESWKEIFKQTVKLQHIFDEHISETDILVHVVPNNRSYFQQQLSIVVDMLCNKRPKRQMIFIHKPVYFQHAAIQIETYINVLKEEFEKSLVHKYGEKIIGYQWKKEYLDILSDTVLKFEILSPSPSISVKIKFLENKNISVINKTGTFIQYNYARLSTLFEQYMCKVNSNIYPSLPDIENVNFLLLTLDEEWNLLFNYLLVFPQFMSYIDDELESSTLKLEMPIHKVCHFLTNLVKDLSMYYSRIHILTEPRSHLMQTMFARLWLLKGVQQIICNSFKLFNISPLKKM